MLPVGQLMIEHRLIERVIKLLSEELARIDKNNNADVNFLEAAADFMETYADRCHHGKEEDILFTSLEDKPLTQELKKILAELVEEHILSRKALAGLKNAKAKYKEGEKKAIKAISAAIKIMVDLYPPHIEKEDKRFFLPCMKYFSQSEKGKMLKEFLEFDRNLIHEKYKAVTEGLIRPNDLRSLVSSRKSWVH